MLDGIASLMGMYANSNSQGLLNSQMLAAAAQSQFQGYQVQSPIEDHTSRLLLLIEDSAE